MAKQKTKQQREDEQMTIDDVQDKVNKLLARVQAMEDHNHKSWQHANSLADRIFNNGVDIESTSDDLNALYAHLSTLRDRMGEAGEDEDGTDDDSNDMPRITIDDKNPNIIASIIEESDKSITFTVANVGRRAATVGDITVRSHIFKRYSPVTKHGKMSRSGFKLKDADVDLDVAIVRDLRIGAGVTDTIRLEVV